MANPSKAKKPSVKLAIMKCLTDGRLTPAELTEISKLKQSDLLRRHGCDLFMAEKVMLFIKQENYRLRAQHQFTKLPDYKGGYPAKPYSRTSPLQEGMLHEALFNMEELLHAGREEMDDEPASQSAGDEVEQQGRMMDYGKSKSDSGEGRMMKQFLKTIAVDAYEFQKMLDDQDDLPEWCHYKIAQAQEMIQSIHNYLKYEIEDTDEENDMDAGNDWDELESDDEDEFEENEEDEEEEEDEDEN